MCVFGGDKWVNVAGKHFLLFSIFHVPIQAQAHRHVTCWAKGLWVHTYGLALDFEFPTSAYTFTHLRTAENLMDLSKDEKEILGR